VFGSYLGIAETSLHETTILFGSLGITQHLIQGGIAWLEEVRSSDGDLSDLFIRVRGIQPLIGWKDLLMSASGQPRESALAWKRSGR